MGKVKRLLSRMYNTVAVIDSVTRPCRSLCRLRRY